jgi:hypothetical protein
MMTTHNEQIAEIIKSVVEAKEKTAEEPFTLDRLNKEIHDDVDSIFLEADAEDDNTRDMLVEEYFNDTDFSTRTNITIKDFDGSTMLDMISFVAVKAKDKDIILEEHYGYGFERLFNAYAYWIARDYIGLELCECDCGCCRVADAGCHGVILCDDCRNMCDPIEPVEN